MSPVSPGIPDIRNIITGIITERERAETSYQASPEVVSNPQTISMLDILVKYQVVLMSEEHDIVTVQRWRRELTVRKILSRNTRRGCKC